MGALKICTEIKMKKRESNRRKKHEHNNAKRAAKRKTKKNNGTRKSRSRQSDKGRHAVLPDHGAGPSARPRAQSVGTTALLNYYMPVWKCCWVVCDTCQQWIHEGCCSLVWTRDVAYVELEDSHWQCTTCRPSSDAAAAFDGDYSQTHVCRSDSA